MIRIDRNAQSTESAPPTSARWRELFAYSAEISAALDTINKAKLMRQEGHSTFPLFAAVSDAPYIKKLLEGKDPGEDLRVKAFVENVEHIIDQTLEWNRAGLSLVLKNTCARIIEDNHLKPINALARIMIWGQERRKESDTPEALALKFILSKCHNRSIIAFAAYELLDLLSKTTGAEKVLANPGHAVESSFADLRTPQNS